MREPGIRRAVAALVPAWIASAAACCCIACCNSAAAQALSRPAAVTVLVSQAIAGPQDGARSSLQIRVGFPAGADAAGGSAGAYTLDSAARDPAAYALSGLVATDYGRGVLDRATIATRAQAALAQQWPQLHEQLTALARTLGAGLVFFSSAQRIVAAGDPRTQYLTFSAAVDHSGRASYGALQVRASVPVYLYAVYTPLRTAAEVPARWAYPQAGTLRWQLVDAQWQPLGPVTVLQTNGVYDEPAQADHADQVDQVDPVDPVDQTAAGAAPAVAPLQGLNCLVRHAPACNSGAAPDLLTLIAKSGADGALLDYRRPVQAHCVERPLGSGTATVCERAVDGIAITLRTLSLGGCAAAGSGGAGGLDTVLYRNVGIAAQTLEADTLRVWVDQQARQPVQLDTRQALFSTGAQSYDRQLALPRVQAAAIAATAIINPLADTPPLVSIDDSAGALRQLAPLRTDSAPASSQACSGAPDAGHGRGQVRGRKP